MNLLTMPTSEDLAREQIELAWRAYDFCRTCGQPMAIEVHGAGLWVECASLRSLRGIRLRVGTHIHERHPIDLPDDVMLGAAA